MTIARRASQRRPPVNRPAGRVLAGNAGLPLVLLEVRFACRFFIVLVPFIRYRFIKRMTSPEYVRGAAKGDSGGDEQPNSARDFKSKLWKNTESYEKTHFRRIIRGIGG